MPLRIWTIGHSTRSIDEFVTLLRSAGIELLADVRKFPGSAKYPHFNADALHESLAGQGIAYEHFLELGGRRPARKDSRNTVWRNASFRGYADYMETDEFRLGIDRLSSAAARYPTAVMCAEAVWWRCHRALIADHLKAAGAEVFHIVSSAMPEPHPFTSAAKIVNGELTYAE